MGHRVNSHRIYNPPKKEEKPDCYNCIHRTDVEGSTHSSCRCEGTLLHLINLLHIPDFLGLATEEQKLVIKGNQYGIDSGWFKFPIDYDPVWLEECSGFKEKEKK